MQDSRDCWPMNSNDSVWLDPLHLPRAPILQHNVSLCHGRATLLYSPSAAPAASPVAWSRVYGILDFGNSNSTAEYRSRRSSIGEGGRRRFFNMYFPSEHPLRSPPSRGGRFRSSVSLHTAFWINERIHDATSDESWKYCRFCDATIYLSCGGPSGNNDSRW